jgi:hypothetical protein
MIPVNNFEGIEQKESQYENNHVVIFLLVKPSDNNSGEVISKFNYLHHKSDNYCNIYPIGYSEEFYGLYRDAEKVGVIDGKKLEYSDKCFLEFIDSISKRIPSWKYVEDIQVVVLQSAIRNGVSKLNFSNYYSLDINYALKKGYIESFAKFIGYLINSSKSEVDAFNAVRKTNRSRISPKKVIEGAIMMIPKLPKSVKRIIADRVFFIPSNVKP